MGLAARRGLTANQIKWIAIGCMLIDHIAWAFVPFSSVAGQMMHIVGRVTAPTMCFFIAEGYAHTRSVPRYLLRLGLFALISQFPFTLFESGKFLFIDLNAGNEMFSVIYTLCLSLLAVWTWDTVKKPVLRASLIAGLCLLSLPGDWMCFDILFSLIFWAYRGNFKQQMFWFTFAAIAEELIFIYSAATAGASVVSQLFQLGVLLCLPILARYNGQRGGGRNSKWTFYIFYPVHLLILGLIHMWI